MLSVIVGICLGYWVSERKMGLIFSAIYGLLMGIFTASVSYRDGAGLMVPVLAIAGLVIGWGIKWVRRPREQSGAELMAKDVTDTIIWSYDKLKQISRNSDDMVRHYEVNACLAALIGSLRDAYSKLPSSKQSVGWEIVEETAAGNVERAIQLSNAILNLVVRCPNETNAKMNVMIFIISPESIPVADRPRVGILAGYPKPRIYQ